MEAMNHALFITGKALREFNQSNWQGFRETAFTIINHINDNALVQLLLENVSPQEKKQKLYDYIYHLVLECKRMMEEGNQPSKEHYMYMTSLIRELSWFKDEESYEMTERIFRTIEVLYA